MENNNYPTWLVPLDIAKELKDIGFDTPCSFYYDEELLKISPWHDEEFAVTNWNDKLFHYCVSLPTYEQVFEWFRERGFRISLENHEDSTKFMFYNMEIEDGKHFKGKSSNYNKARKSLIKELINNYKERHYE